MKRLGECDIDVRDESGTLAGIMAVRHGMAVTVSDFETWTVEAPPAIFIDRNDLLGLAREVALSERDGPATIMLPGLSGMGKTHSWSATGPCGRSRRRAAESSSTIPGKCRPAMESKLPSRNSFSIMNRGRCPTLCRVGPVPSL